MKTNISACAGLTLFMTVIFHTVYAVVDSTATHAVEKYPSAVLVKLQTRQSMIAGLEKDKRYKQLEEARKDIAAEQAATINDFKDNFSYCPVYYFIDTNLQFIQNKQFAGVLMDADRNVLPEQTIRPSDSDYVIVFFGYPTEQAKYHNRVRDTSNYTFNSGEPFGRGLVILNDKMEQINYLYELAYNGVFRSKATKQYSYESKHFNIEYSPCAGDFDYKLKHRKAKNYGELKMQRRLQLTKKQKGE